MTIIAAFSLGALTLGATLVAAGISELRASPLPKRYSRKSR
jgi:hypothetical protein